MKGRSDIPSEDTIRRYLLGQLSSEEQASFEERFFSNDDQFEQVEAAEDELIYVYLRGELTAADRESFETHFLSTPERRFRLAATRGLQQSLVEDRADRSRPQAARRRFAAWPATPWLIPMTASLLICLGLTSYLWLQLSQQQTRMGADQQDWKQQLAARDTRISDLENQLQNHREELKRAQEGSRAVETKPSRFGTLSFLLTPVLAKRGEQPASITLAVPSDRIPVQLNLDLEVDSEQSYASYRVVLEAADGNQVLAREGLRSGRGGRTLPLIVPPGLLPPGQYRIVVFGRKVTGDVEEIDGYSFRVVRP